MFTSNGMYSKAAVFQVRYIAVLLFVFELLPARATAFEAVQPAARNRSSKVSASQIRANETERRLQTVIFSDSSPEPYSASRVANILSRIHPEGKITIVYDIKKVSPKEIRSAELHLKSLEKQMRDLRRSLADQGTKTTRVSSERIDKKIVEAEKKIEAAEFSLLKLKERNRLVGTHALIFEGASATSKHIKAAIEAMKENDYFLLREVTSLSRENLVKVQSIAGITAEDLGSNSSSSKSGARMPASVRDAAQESGVQTVFQPPGSRYRTIQYFRK